MKLNSRIQQIGIDRIVRLEWLERTAQLALASNHPSTVKQNMLEYLAPVPNIQHHLSGSLAKTVTILMNVWLSGPKGACKFEERRLGVAAYKVGRRSSGDTLGCAYGNLSLLEHCGGPSKDDFLRLQETITAEQVPAPHMRKSTARENPFSEGFVTTSDLLLPGVLLLQETGNKKASIVVGCPYLFDDPKLITWMIEQPCL